MRTSSQHIRSGLLGGAGLLLVLLGVIGMHGIGGHGNHGAPASHAAPGTDLAVAHASPPSTVHRPAAHVAAGHVAALTADPAPEDLNPWVALCLAVLVGGALLAVRGRAGIAARGVPPVWPVSSSLAPGRRDRDPPSLAVLRVRRC